MKNKTIYASFKVRLIAHIIDMSLLSLATLLLTIILDPLPTTHSIIFKEISYLILSILYYTILTASSKHGSFGKQIMGIMVVDEEKKRLSLKHSFARYLAYYFSYITLGIGFIMIAITRKHIGLHDKIAHTYVIYNNS
jgi:uncharacterized RDD family membrane protein YckC